MRRQQPDYYPLLEEYHHSRCLATRNLLLEKCRYLAVGALRYFPLPSRIQEEDILSVAFLSLIKGIERWDPAKGAKPETWLIFCVNNGIKEYLRGFAHDTREERQAVKELEAARDRLAQEGKPHPTSEELAAALGVDLDTFAQRYLRPSTQDISLEWLADGGSEPAVVGAGFEDEEPNERALMVYQQIMLAAGNLPPQELELILLVYREGTSFDGAAEELGVTRHRAHQIHRSALRRLRSWLEDPYEESPFQISPRTIRETRL